MIRLQDRREMVIIVRPDGTNIIKWQRPVSMSDLYAAGYRCDEACDLALAEAGILAGQSAALLREYEAIMADAMLACAAFHGGEYGHQ